MLELVNSAHRHWLDRLSQLASDPGWPRLTLLDPSSLSPLQGSDFPTTHSYLHSLRGFAPQMPMTSHGWTKLKPGAQLISPRRGRNPGTCATTCCLPEADQQEVTGSRAGTDPQASSDTLPVASKPTRSLLTGCLQSTRRHCQQASQESTGG